MSTRYTAEDYIARSNRIIDDDVNAGCDCVPPASCIWCDDMRELAAMLRQAADLLAITKGDTTSEINMIKRDDRFEQIKETLRVEWRLKAQGIHHDHLSDLAYLIVIIEYERDRTRQAAAADLVAQQGLAERIVNAIVSDLNDRAWLSQMIQEIEPDVWRAEVLQELIAVVEAEMRRLPTGTSEAAS